jgi:putative transposase
MRSKYQLRSRLTAVTNSKTKKQNTFFNNKEWLKSCPSAIRKGAVYDATAKLAACFSNLKAKNIKKFSSPFRTKKKEQLQGYSYSLEKNNISKQDNELFIFPSILEDMRYFGTKQLHKLMPGDKPEYDCKIQKTAYGEYFLIIPYKSVPKPKKTTITNPVSIDPGVRKFLTTYSPVNLESFMIGNRWSTRIMSLLLKLDNMKSKKDKKKALQIRKKVDNLKKELHFKSASFISKRYDLVIMPKLQTQKLSIKAERKLRTKTVRAMLNARHSSFYDCLRDKCWEQGVPFLQVGEAYTSQTCPCCGHLNKCNETYNCKNCSFQHDRDIVGSLNIMLKAVRN